MRAAVERGKAATALDPGGPLAGCGKAPVGRRLLQKVRCKAVDSSAGLARPTSRGGPQRYARSARHFRDEGLGTRG